MTTAVHHLRSREVRRASTSHSLAQPEFAGSTAPLQARIWPKSLKAQINAGDAGDFWGLDAYRLSGPSDRTKTPTHPQFGALTSVKKFRLLEKPPGEWNHCEICAQGEIVTLRINGQEANRATGCSPRSGRVCLTSEGDPYEFRNARLTVLGGEAIVG